MAGANTSLRIKRSTTTGVPGSLQAGELAYSYQSNTMFIGSPAGTGVVNIGGLYYTSQIDSASSANGSNTLVKRDVNGNIAVGYLTAAGIDVSSITGNANSATQFQTDRYINVTGGDITASAQLFNGTANATLSAALNSIAGLTAGTYGGTTVIPIIQVAANGRVMTIANSATISTSLNFAGDTGTDAIDLVTDTLTFTGGAGITSTVGTNSVTFDVDNTVVRANTPSLRQTIDGDVIISGNLSILGTSTTYNVETLTVEDSLIALGKNNASDAVDIGFYGHYNNGADRHAGLMRHSGDGFFYLFDNYNVEPTGNVINVSDGSFRQANLKSNLISQWANAAVLQVGTLNVAGATTLKSLSLTDDLTVSNGGTGASSFTAGAIIIGDGTNPLSTLANSTFTATQSGPTTGTQNNTITSVTVDAYGRFTAATFNQIAGLNVDQGGTGKSSFASGKVVIGNGTGALSELANVTYSLTGTLGAAKTITSLTVDDYGRVSAATAADISGLTVTQGGTGVNTFTSGLMLIGNGTGAIQSIANAGYTLTGTLGAAKTITSLTIDDYGRVTAATAADISGLTVSQGGTGASTFTSKGIVYGDGTNALAVTAASGSADQTWSNQILTVTNAGVPVWSSAIDGGQF
jgi:hypothetical protein